MTAEDRRQNTRNVIALIIAQAVAAAAGLIAFVRIGPIFNVAELGRYGFAASSTVMFGLLAELGIRYVAIKDIAVDKTVSVRVLRHSVAIRLLLSAATMALLAAICAVYPPWRGETSLLLLAGLVAVTQFGAEPLTWVLFGHGRVDIGAGVLVIDRILYLLAINIAAIMWRSAEALFVASLVANLLRSAIAWLWVRPMLKTSPKQREWDPAYFRYLLFDGLALGVAVLVSVGYSQITATVAQSVTTPTELGLYAVALGLVNILLVVPMGLTNALFPALAALVGADETRRLVRMMVYLTLAIVLPLGFIAYFFADRLIGAWFGPQYSGAVVAVRILSIGMIATAFNYLGRILLFAKNRPWIETAIDMCGAAAVIGGAWAAGSRYGSSGIAAAYAIVEIGVLVVKALLLLRVIGGLPAQRVLKEGLTSAAAISLLVTATLWAGSQ